MGQTHRHGLKAPPLRHLRAAAAIEREDRAASSSALHVVFPTTEVTKRGATRKSARGFLARDAAARVAAEVGVDSLPQRSGARLTCYRGTGNFVSHVTGPHRRWERQGENRSAAGFPASGTRRERSERRREGYPPGGTRPRSGLGRGSPVAKRRARIHRMERRIQIDHPHRGFQHRYRRQHQCRQQSQGRSSGGAAA